MVVIPRGVAHGFTTRTGTVIEEVSSYYTQGDSFYTDQTIEANRNRKTFVTLLDGLMLTIVWDVDDVLNDLMSAGSRRRGSRRIRSRPLAYCRYHGESAASRAGRRAAEYLESLDSFRASDRARANCRPIPRCSTGCARYGPRVSATWRYGASAGERARTRPSGCSAISETTSACFGVVPSRLAAGVPAYDRDKGEFLEWFGRAGLSWSTTARRMSRAAERLGCAASFSRSRGTAAAAPSRRRWQQLSQLAERN